MKEVFCPRCRKPVGFPFMKCPECNWYASGTQIDNMKKLAYQYIQTDAGHEDQDIMVMDMVLEEVLQRDEELSNIREKEYSNLSKYTFGKYMKINIGLLFLPYLIVIAVMFGDEGGSDIVPLIFEKTLLFILMCAGMSAFFIAVNTLLFFMARSKLFFLKRDRKRNN